MTAVDLLSDEPGFLAAVDEGLGGDTPIRMDVPGGRLHIDRPLPFLCVCRRAGDGRAAAGAAVLVRGQSSYLVVDAEKTAPESVHRLVRHVVDALADRFGSVALIELWVGESPRDRPAAYRIHLPGGDRPATVDALEKALDEVDLGGRIPAVERVDAAPAAPPGLPPLLDPSQATELGCLHIGLEIPDVFLERASGRPYPLLFRSLEARLGRALRKALFAFAQLQTSLPVDDYRALGRRALVDAVGGADRRLSELAGQLDFLLAVTPVNTQQAWHEFAAAGCDAEPNFHYRPLAVDPDRYRRALYELPVEDVEDPTVAALLRAKRHELDERVAMLEARGTPRFLLESLRAYGGADDDLLHLARALLDRLPMAERFGEVGDPLSAEEFARMARAEMRRYRERYPDFVAGVQVRDDVAGVMVSSGDLLVGKDDVLSAVRAEALLQHEVGTHVVTDINGRAQPLCLLEVGLPGYEETQEGLAVLSEYLAGGLTSGRLAILAARVIGVRCTTDGASFVETFRVLRDEVGLSPARAFGVTARIHRSGGFTKDAIYLRGLDAVLRYLADGGSLEPLLVGKLALRDVPAVEELQWRGVLKPAPVRPRWLEKESCRARLRSVREGLSVLELAGGGAQ